MIFFFLLIVQIYDTFSVFQCPVQGDNDAFFSFLPIHTKLNYDIYEIERLNNENEIFLVNQTAGEKIEIGMNKFFMYL